MRFIQAAFSHAFFVASFDKQAIPSKPPLVLIFPPHMVPEKDYFDRYHCTPISGLSGQLDVGFPLH
jgi:hypothetical protein